MTVVAVIIIILAVGSALIALACCKIAGDCSRDEEEWDTEEDLQE